jgi:hypothetical protein
VHEVSKPHAESVWRARSPCVLPLFSRVCCHSTQLELARRRLQPACREATALLELYRCRGQTANLVPVLLLLAEIHQHADSAVVALPHVLSALSLCEAFSMERHHSYALTMLAELHLRLGTPSQAIALLQDVMPRLLEHAPAALQAVAQQSLGVSQPQPQLSPPPPPPRPPAAPSIVCVAQSALTPAVYGAGPWDLRTAPLAPKRPTPHSACTPGSGRRRAHGRRVAEPRARLRQVPGAQLAHAPRAGGTRAVRARACARTCGARRPPPAPASVSPVRVCRAREVAYLLARTYHVLMPRRGAGQPERAAAVEGGDSVGDDGTRGEGGGAPPCVVDYRAARNRCASTFRWLTAQLVARGRSPSSRPPPPPTPPPHVPGAGASNTPSRSELKEEMGTAAPGAGPTFVRGVVSYLAADLDGTAAASASGADMEDSMQSASGYYSYGSSGSYLDSSADVSGMSAGLTDYIRAHA